MPTKKEVLKAMEVLKIANDEERLSYFKCKCPLELENGYEGFAHRVPIDCLMTPNEIVRSCEEHIKHCKNRIKVLTKLREKTKKHIC